MMRLCENRLSIGRELVALGLFAEGGCLIRDLALCARTTDRCPDWRECLERAEAAWEAFVRSGRPVPLL